MIDFLIIEEASKKIEEVKSSFLEKKELDLSNQSLDENLKINQNLIDELIKIAYFLSVKQNRVVTINELVNESIFNFIESKKNYVLENSEKTASSNYEDFSEEINDSIDAESILDKLEFEIKKERKQLSIKWLSWARELPENFTTKEAMNLGRKFGFSKRTVRKRLQEWNESYFCRKNIGFYEKIY